MNLMRNLNEWELEDIGSLLEILDGCELGDRETSDERVWVLNEDKGFSVRSLFQAMSSSTSVFPGPIHLKQVSSHEDLIFPFCLLWWDHAPTLDNLIRRGFISLNRCYMCGSDSESSNHLFIHCQALSALWQFRATTQA